MDGLSANQFQEVHMNDFFFAADLVTHIFLLYDIDIPVGNIGDLGAELRI